MKAIPNKGDYYQPYEVWFTIGIACKRIGISRKCFETWTGDTAVGWDNWDISNKGYGLNFLRTVARMCSNIIDGLTACRFLQSDCKPDIEYCDQYCATINFTNMQECKEEEYDDEQEECKGDEDCRYEKIINPNHIYNISTKALVSQSTLGSGKSVQSRYIINNYDWESILVVTPRISYSYAVLTAMNEKTKYNFIHYKKENVAYEKYVICSMESLHKIPCQQKFELVIIDEVESNLSQFTSTTMKEIDKCQSIFHNILINSKHILMLDGFINPNRTITLLKKLNISYTFLKNTYKHKDKKITRLNKMKEKDDIINFIETACINENKKIFMVVTRQKVAEALYDELEPILHAHNKKIKIYHSKLPQQQKIVHNANEEWVEYDIIITTTTITVGIDFTVDHFDFGFLYADYRCGIPRDHVQTMLRCRKLNEWYMVMNCTQYSGFCPQMSLFHNSFKFKCEMVEEYISKHKTIKLSHWFYMPEWLQELYYTNAYEQILSKKYYKLFLQYFLSEIGFKLIDYTYDALVINIKNIPNFDDVGDIDKDTYEEYGKLLDCNMLLQDEFFEFKKYDLLHNEFKGKYDKIWPFWVNKYQKFRNLKDEMISTVSQRFNKDTKIDRYVERSNLKFKQLQCVLEFKELFGFENTLDYDWRINGSDLDKLIDKIINNDKQYSKIFDKKKLTKNTENKTRRKVLEVINKYLKQWGLNKITRKKRKRQRNKGKRKYCNDDYEYGFSNTYNLTFTKKPVECQFTGVSDTNSD